MSGGHFDYKDYIIDEIADSIERTIEKNGKTLTFDQLDYWDKEQYSYSEELYNKAENKPTHIEYSPESIKIFKEAVIILRKASIYAHRIDWLLSGDDGEDDLAKCLEEDLAELNKKWPTMNKTCNNCLWYSSTESFGSTGYCRREMKNHVKTDECTNKKQYKPKR